MEIISGAEIHSLCLWLISEKTIVIPDLHLGYEQSLSETGNLLPSSQYGSTIALISKALNSINSKPEKIVLLGDVKHDFGKISSQEWQDITDFLFFLKSKSGNVVIIKGNHDNAIAPIASKISIPVKDFEVSGRFFLCHGDKIPSSDEFENAEAIIIGHEHPAVLVSSKVRKEKYRCFLKGKYSGKELIVMPSMNVFSEGSNILSQKHLSPFLKQDISEFEAIISEDKAYNFGKLKDLPGAENDIF